jgi:hypothetical protein
MIATSSQHASPKICSKHKPPMQTGIFFPFEVTETERNFWNGLANDEKVKLRDRAFTNCFYEELHEQMKTKQRLFH